MEQSYNGILPSNKKGGDTDICHNTAKSQNITLSERRQTQGSHRVWPHLCEMFRKGKSIQIGSGCCLSLDMRTGINCKQTEESYWGDGNILKLDCGDSCTTLVIY